MRPLRRPGRSEGGSAMIIALVFVTAIGLVIAAVLAFADVGIRSSKVFKRETQLAYTADAGIAAATRKYATTGPCENFTAPLVERAALASPVNESGVIVRCEGPSPAGSKATQPINSLLALGSGGDGGVASTEELRLLGDVYSNTTVSTLPSAAMVVQGDVSAVGDCDGPIQTLPVKPLSCANKGRLADPSRGKDPHFTKARSVVPQRKAVPACPAGWLVAIEPGYYDDTAALNALTNGGCAGRVVWFQPGTYYFDLGYATGPSTWTVDDATVDIVGGTPRLAFDAALPRPTLNVPGSCKTEADGFVPGVQMIAGGATRLEILAGRMELCATASADQQQIALFGVRDPLASHVLESTDITATGAFTGALNAQVVDEESQDCVVPAMAPCTLTASAALGAAQPAAALDFERFRPGIPEGSVFKTADTASLVVKHQRSGDATDISVTLDFPGNTCTGPQALTPNATPTSDAVNLRACGLTRPEDLNGLTVSYAAALATGGVAADVQLDGVVVQLAYQTPVTRKPTTPILPSAFANASNALEIGEEPEALTADATLNTSTTTASVTLAALGDPPISPLATIDSVVLRVAHQDVGDTGAPTITVTFPSSTCTDLPLQYRPGAIGDDRIGLSACGFDGPNRLKGLSVTFTAKLNAGGTAATSRLDGIWLETVVTEVPGPPGPLPSALRQPGAVTSDGSPVTAAFANPDRAKVIGEGLNADATLTGPLTSAALTVKEFNAIPVLPPGSRISSAKLRVDHQEDADVGVALAATFPGTTCPAETITPSVGALATHTSADLALCGLTSAERLTGLSATYTATRTGSATAVSESPSTTADVTGTTNFTNPERALVIDGVPDVTNADAGGSMVAARGRLNGGNTLASIRLSGYNQIVVPPGSTIESAKLRVSHQEVGNVTGVAALLDFTGNTCVTAQPLALRTGTIGVDDTIDVKACGLTDPSKLAAFSVVYSASRSVPGNGDGYLDGIVLDLTYRPPLVDRLDGIELDLLFERPTFRPLCTAPAGCDLLRVAPATTPAIDTATRFVANGTIYAPSAGVDVKMYGLDVQVLRRGVVARSIKLGLQPKAGYGRPTGAIPPELVYFTAYPDVTLAPANVVAAPPPTGFTNPDGARSRADGAVATAAIDSDIATPAPDTATVVLDDYSPTSLASDAKVDQAVLRVRHEDIGNTVKVTVEVDGTSCVVDRELAANPTGLEEDQIDLGTCGTKLATPANLDKVKVTYTVALDLGGTTANASLDSVTLELLSGPLVRATMTFDREKETVDAWSVLR